MRVDVVVGIALFGGSLCLGCVSTVLDRTDAFRIEGAVISQLGAPLEGAMLSFVDTGLDDWRSGRYSSGVLSRSDENGRVSATYEYSWGYRMQGPASSRRLRDFGSRRFAIIVRLAEFAEERREFDLGTLDLTDEGTFIVPLGTVVMRKGEAGE